MAPDPDELAAAAVEEALAGLDDDTAPGAAAEDEIAHVDERSARWTLRLADGSTLDADVLVVTAPADAALALLPGVDDGLAELAALDWPTASSVELVTLVLTDDRVGAAPVGTGVLVADGGASGVGAKAMTHSSAKWAWVAEAAGPGRHVVRLSYGRAGRPAESLGLSDDDLRERAVADAAALLNIPLAASDVSAFARTPWTNALPYATVGQRERIARVRDEVENIEGVEMTGSWLTGTGLASVIPDARRVAERARGLRWKSLTDDLER